MPPAAAPSAASREFLESLEDYYEQLRGYCERRRPVPWRRTPSSSNSLAAFPSTYYCPTTHAPSRSLSAGRPTTAETGGYFSVPVRARNAPPDPYEGPYERERRLEREAKARWQAAAQEMEAAREAQRRQHHNPSQQDAEDAKRDAQQKPFYIHYSPPKRVTSPTAPHWTHPVHPDSEIFSSPTVRKADSGPAAARIPPTDVITPGQRLAAAEGRNYETYRQLIGGGRGRIDVILKRNGNPVAVGTMPAAPLPPPPQPPAELMRRLRHLRSTADSAELWGGDANVASVGERILALLGGGPIAPAQRRSSPQRPPVVRRRRRVGRKKGALPPPQLGIENVDSFAAGIDVALPPSAPKLQQQTALEALDNDDGDDKAGRHHPSENRCRPADEDDDAGIVDIGDDDAEAFDAAVYDTIFVAAAPRHHNAAAATRPQSAPPAITAAAAAPLSSANPAPGPSAAQHQHPSRIHSASVQRRIHFHPSTKPGPLGESLDSRPPTAAHRAAPAPQPALPPQPQQPQRRPTSASSRSSLPRPPSASSLRSSSLTPSQLVESGDRDKAAEALVTATVASAVAASRALGGKPSNPMAMVFRPTLLQLKQQQQQRDAFGAGHYARATELARLRKAGGTPRSSASARSPSRGTQASAPTPADVATTTTGTQTPTKRNRTPRSRSSASQTQQPREGSANEARHNRRRRDPKNPPVQRLSEAGAPPQPTEVDLMPCDSAADDSEAPDGEVDDPHNLPEAAEADRESANSAPAPQTSARSASRTFENDDYCRRRPSKSNLNDEDDDPRNAASTATSTNLESVSTKDLERYLLHAARRSGSRATLVAEKRSHRALPSATAPEAEHSIATTATDGDGGSSRANPKSRTTTRPAHQSHHRKPAAVRRPSTSAAAPVAAIPNEVTAPALPAPSASCPTSSSPFSSSRTCTRSNCSCSDASEDEFFEDDDYEECHEGTDSAAFSGESSFRSELVEEFIHPPAAATAPVVVVNRKFEASAEEHRYRHQPRSASSLPPKILERTHTHLIVATRRPRHPSRLPREPVPIREPPPPSHARAPHPRPPTPTPPSSVSQRSRSASLASSFAEPPNARLPTVSPAPSAPSRASPPVVLPRESSVSPSTFEPDVPARPPRLQGHPARTHPSPAMGAANEPPPQSKQHQPRPPTPLATTTPVPADPPPEPGRKLSPVVAPTAIIPAPVPAAPASIPYFESPRVEDNDELGEAECEGMPKGDGEIEAHDDDDDDHRQALREREEEEQRQQQFLQQQEQQHREHLERQRLRREERERERLLHLREREEKKETQRRNKEQIRAVTADEAEARAAIGSVEEAERDTVAAAEDDARERELRWELEQRAAELLRLERAREDAQDRRHRAHGGAGAHGDPNSRMAVSIPHPHWIVAGPAHPVPPRPPATRAPLRARPAVTPTEPAEPSLATQEVRPPTPPPNLVASEQRESGGNDGGDCHEIPAMHNDQSSSLSSSIHSFSSNP